MEFRRVLFRSEKIERQDSKFRLITAQDIFTLALQKKWVRKLETEDLGPISDFALLITSSGLCSLAKRLDCATRLPTEVLVHREGHRSEEHTSELQSLMRISYAVFCLKKNKKITW